MCFGWMIIMGLKKLLNQRLHRSTYKGFFRSPKISRAMSKIRLKVILRYIHLVGNREVVVENNNPGYNKLAKIQWLIDAHNDIYSKFWTLKENLTVDEIMIRYIGNYSHMRQYMKAKLT